MTSQPLARRGLLMAAAAAPWAAALPAGAAAPSGTGLNAFAFQTGSWRVRHRKLRERLAGSTDFYEFDGECRAWEVLGGAGNVEDNLINDPAGAYRAAAFRRLDPATGLWAIWWFDPRQARLDPPVQGRFENGVGTFLADDELRGRPIKVRFRWSDITRTSARWEQAFSPDGGATWETNWTMAFTRTDG